VREKNQGGGIGSLELQDFDVILSSAHIFLVDSMVPL